MTSPSPPANDERGLDAPTDLRCEYRTTTLGIDTPRPRLSWCVGDQRRGARQTAYQVLVGSDEHRLADGRVDVWDSDRVSSHQSVLVAYAGPALQSRRRYWWMVRTWDTEARASRWSKPAWWEMGLLDEADWRACWISIPDEALPSSGEGAPCRSLSMRKEFEIFDDIARARVYVSGLGCYQLALNGQRVGRDLFTPGWTVYENRIQYQTYDVTGLLQRGKNAIGAILGNGWWAGGLSLGRGKIERASTGNLRLIVQLEIELADGTRQCIATDESWRVAPSPILENSFYHGETHDARLEQPGWDRSGFAAADWPPAIVLDDPVDRFVAQQTYPIRVTQELPAQDVFQSQPGVYIFDFGQNHAGRVRLRVSGQRGQRVQLRFAETLNADGTLDRRNLVGARSTDTYILKGVGEETWEPRFTYRGYRYAELTGYLRPPSNSTVTSQVLHSDLPVVGRFECSNDLLNRIQHNIVWALHSNLMSVPTDCPQRDERLGWLGDGHVIAPTACWNMDMATFFAKWLRDIRDSQHESGYIRDVAPAAVLRGPAAPGWGDAIVGIPWTLYRFYGDTRVIEENFDAMRAWVEYMRAHAPNLLYRCPHELKEDGYGDWVATVESPRRPIAAAFFHYSTKLLANMAEIIGRTKEAETYRTVAHEIRTAFNAAFFDPETNNYEGRTQAANLIPLAFGLASREHRSGVLQNLVRDIEARETHLSTGFLGTAYALPLLSANGHHELAYRLATQRTFPSWGYMVECGATTMCELWNPDTGDPRMNSWNHFALGTIGQWFFESLGGVSLLPTAPTPEDSLSRGVLIRPRPTGDLTWARVDYESLHGSLRSIWRKDDDGFSLDLVIPANTSARVGVPTFGWPNAIVHEGRTVLLNGVERVGKSEGLHPAGVDAEGFALFDAGAGEYAFRVTPVRRDPT